MAGDPQVLSVLAQALTYPDEATAALVARSVDVPQWTVEGMQEQFIAAFDFDPKCSLDIGWHLYGDNYDRGDFLVRMRDLLARHGIDEGHELPDHLPQVLRLLARLPADEAAMLAEQSIVPALDKILDGLGAREGPYPVLMRDVRAAVSALARRDVDEVSHV